MTATVMFTKLDFDKSVFFKLQYMGHVMTLPSVRSKGRAVRAPRSASTAKRK